MKVVVNCGKGIGRQDRFWRSTGFTPSNLLLDPAMRQTLAYVGSLPRRGVEHVRIHFLLDLVKATGLETEQPVYDWSDLDAGLDVLVDNGLRPFFELMGNPSGFFSDFCNDGQLHAWRRMVRDVARHCMDRYGRKEVEGWYFETWNEPDGGWWHQWPQVAPFCNYYDACSEGLRDANPKLRFGGPGSCRHMSDLLKAFLEHCDRGRNYFTGQRGVRLDFLSVHEKGMGANPEDIDPDTRGICDRELRLVEYVRARHPRLAKVPFMNNECDPIVGWHDIHTWHARPYYAVWICRTIHQHQVRLIEKERCPYALLSNDNGFLGAWGMRTHLVRFGDDKQLEKDEFDLVKKPALNVMAMLALLGEERLDVSPECASAEGDVGALATRGNGEVAVLLYHGRDAIYSSGSQRVALELREVPFRDAVVEHYRIDDRHGDPFSIWARRGGPRRLSFALLQELREYQELARMEPPARADVRGGRLSLCFDMPLPSVSLVLLTQKREGRPPRVAALRAEKFKGCSESENILLRWNGADAPGLRTYEVFFSERRNGAFARVNGPDLIGSAFLHARKTAGGRGFYRVRAVDLWGRAGAFSSSVSI